MTIVPAELRDAHARLPFFRWDDGWLLRYSMRSWFAREVVAMTNEPRGAVCASRCMRYFRERFPLTHEATRERQDRTRVVLCDHEAYLDVLREMAPHLRTPPAIRALRAAIASGRPTHIVKAHVNDENLVGDTPLSWLVRRQSMGDDGKIFLKMMRQLIHLGAHVNHVNPCTKHRRSVLLLASNLPHNVRIRACRLLLEAGADVNYATFPTRLTLLTIAVQRNDLDMFKCAAEHGARLDQCDAEGSTPLAWVCYKQTTPARRRMLDHLLGKTAAVVNKYSVNFRGETPLHETFRSGNAYAAHRLLESGYGEHLNVANEDGDTPLLLACRAGRLSLAVQMLRQGADAAARNRQLRSCLHELCSTSPSSECADVELLTRIVRSSPREYLDAPDENGHAPLHFAVACHHRVVEVLLRCGASREYEHLHRRLRCCSQSPVATRDTWFICRCFLRAGLDANHHLVDPGRARWRGVGGWSLLDVAASRRYMSRTASLLLAWGARPRLDPRHRSCAEHRQLENTLHELRRESREHRRSMTGFRAYLMCLSRLDRRLPPELLRLVLGCLVPLPFARWSAARERFEQHVSQL